LKNVTLRRRADGSSKALGFSNREFYQTQNHRFASILPC
jgi:hypothetical protein